MLSGISIVCFAASYAVTLGMEVSRLFFRLRVRWLVMIGFAFAGIFAHTAYLFAHARSELDVGRDTLLSSWYDWCLLVAWVLAIAYLGLAVRRPRNTVGIFLLPIVLALIAVAYGVQDIRPFAREQALGFWGAIHGVMFLLGTVAAALGFAAGVMYLLQSYRLKHKLASRPGFQLPSLEWLQRFNRRSMLISTFLLFLGLVAGIVLSIIQRMGHAGTMTWRDPVVFTSLILFLWFATASLIETIYKPAREGRKVAYVTLASFLFLALLLALVVLGQHGVSSRGSERRSLGDAPGDSRAVKEADGVGGEL